MNTEASNNIIDIQTDDKSMDNISQASSPHDNSLTKEEDKIKSTNDSILSSSSSSCSSFSPNLCKNNPAVKFDWYRQYEDSLKLFNHHRLTGFQNFIKPNHSSPISVHHNNTQINDSSILIDRFYPQFPVPHQALLAQYAQFYGQNQLNNQFHHGAFAVNQNVDAEKERERLLANLTYANQQRQDSMSESHKDDKIRRNRDNSSGNSRSPSPSSSQHSAQIDCDEEENLAEDSQSINAANGEWTYEEQFKQLYELSDDSKRKEFLDDLFSFMQKRGSPVNRIPIMAKHVLDLYELYRLVVSKGGLVEVINKKLWREITKGLNLPSSITSAAFTLRTQYMKYLYPYECEKLKMSTPSELQAAIDGNRREGRRPVYGYDYTSPNSTNVASNITPNQSIQNSQNVPPQLPIHHSHALMAHPQHNSHHAALLAAAAAAAAAAAQHHNHPSAHLFENSNGQQSGLAINHHNHHHHHQQEHHVTGQNSTSMLPPFLKNYFEINTPPSSTASNLSTSSENNQNISSSSTNNSSEADSSSNRPSIKRPFENDLRTQETNSKRILLENLVTNKNSESKNSKMNIKIFSKENDFINIDKSLSISLEFNGCTYHGTLYPSRLDNNGVQIQIPLEDVKKESNSLKKTDLNSFKTDIVF